MVSERDRSYMRRLGELKEASRRAEQERHSALTLAERLRKSWQLYETYRHSANLSARVDDPQPFYDRARALGLYRPRGSGAP